MINRLKIEIKGKNTNYLLKEIISKKINIYSLEKTSNSILLIIDYSDYKKIKEIKTTYKITIVKRYGLSRLKEILKKYLYFILFFIVGIIINIILSNIVFKIEIIHPNKKLVNIIYKDLNDLGLKKYRFKITDSKKQEIKEKLLLKEKNKIEWVEIENIGTKYIIKIEEKKNNKKIDKCSERNIIAKKDSMIIDIDAYEGEIKRKVNDYVSKGEIIISGFIYNKDKIVSKRCAKGKVYGEVWYKVKVSIPINYKDEELLNNKDHGINIKIFKKEYNLGNKLRDYKKYEYNIINSKIIPISISLSTYQEIKKIRKIYTLDNVDEIALSTAEKELKKDTIISKKVLKKIKKNSKIEVDVFFKIKEDITSYQDISNVNIEEMNKKEE